MKSTLFRSVLVVLLATVVAFVVVPLFIASQSAADLGSIDLPAMTLFGLMIAAMVTAALGVLLGLLRLLGLERFAGSCALFVLAWAVVAGLFLPVCTSAGMIDADKVPPDLWHLAAVVVLSTGAGLLTSAAHKRLALRFLVFAALGGLGVALFSIHRAPSAPPQGAMNVDTSDDPFALSRSRNIVVLSFDGLPGPLVTKLIRDSDEFSAAFKDFILFENAVSQSPATEASLMADVYGVQDYKALGDTQASVSDALEERFKDSILPRRVDDSFAYGYVFPSARLMDLSGPSDAVESAYLGQYKAFDVLRYASARLATSLVLTDTGWGAMLDALRDRLVSAPPESALVAQLKRDAGPAWDRNMAASIRHYDYWLDRLGASDKGISVRYLHFTFTHFPVNFDEQCGFRSDGEHWHRSHQNEAGVRAQATCALRKFALFLEKLETLGVYDQSLVVLKSDHGEPAHYFSSYPDNLRLNGHSLWGYNRYRPLLMIKDFGAAHATAPREPSLVLLGDLARTLCTRSGLDLECDRFHGADLLSANLKDFDEPYFLYVVRNAESNFRFDTHLSITVPSRKLDVLEALEASGTVKISDARGKAGASGKSGD